MEQVKVEYAPGMRIIVRGEEWIVKRVETNSLGNQTLQVVGISNLVKDYESRFMTDLEKDIEIVDPAKVKLIPDDSAFFKKSKLYIESHLRQKIPTDTKIHIGDKAAMDLMPYQLEPAQIALNRTRQRILIADTVGLGKTLEAGILMSELIARGKGKRILVVTVKSMMTQFQKEMWNRFTIPLVRLDSGKIQRVRARIPANYNPFYYYDKTIISVDTLKNDLDYRTHLENAWWDIIVIDEAHNVAKRGKHSQREKLAKLLANKSDTLIMLSATPHDGKSESFASLMNMLDPTAIANDKDYGPEDIDGLCIRRFKKDVQDQVVGSFKERKISIEECKASAREENAFDIFADMKLQMDEGRTKGSGQLFKTSLEKALFSSPAACIKSIDERLKKLKKFGENGIPDIATLSELRDALVQVKPEDFSRYTTLLKILKSADYGWNPKNNSDRIVIFTERIETMKFLAENLQKDLGLSANAIQSMYGGMNDKELQRIVDEFGRPESPIRILVASDVASEGINLHYLSHRLIHFDIPWSLMVFQQRNGRIDRYGQKETPDIRYMLISSDNEKIHGDARIMEILVQKEEQAYKNIGDPAVLFGKFNQEEEELETAKAIEGDMSASDFESQLDTSEDEFDPFEMMMQSATSKETTKIEYSDEETLYDDIEYIRSALSVFSDTENIEVKDMQSVKGLHIKLTDEIKKKLEKVLPDEAMPSDGIMRLSPDVDFCKKEMARCMANALSEVAWPATGFLWKLHPLFSWINDKAGILYRRGEVPFIALADGVSSKEMLFIVEGQIPNRNSTSVVDEWFALSYVDGKYSGVLTLPEVIGKTHLTTDKLPNHKAASAEAVAFGESLLPDVVNNTNKIMEGKYQEYKDRTDPYIYSELERLEALKEKHKDAQLSIFDLLGQQRKKSEKEREIDEMFKAFYDWERDSVEIKNNPYIQIIAVVTGVN
ncbi:MAG: DEAD/DEAH box helicase [Acetatifactor sp.]